jgi:hypothetical protein
MPPQINLLIHAAFERVAARFLAEISSRARLHASTLDYSIFTNCMDSSLWFDDERLQDLYETWRRL